MYSMADQCADILEAMAIAGHDRLAARGYFVRSEGSALLRVDGVPVQEQVLKNGSVVECGSVKCRFALTPPVQRTGIWIVCMVVAILVAVLAIELVVITQWLR